MEFKPAANATSFGCNSAYCLVKSCPSAHFSYKELLSAYHDNTILDLGTSSTIVILPRTSDQQKQSSSPVARALAQLRDVLKYEAKPVDRSADGSLTSIWVLPFDALLVLGSLSRLGFLASQCSVDADGVHTWTLRCSEPEQSDFAGDAEEAEDADESETKETVAPVEFSRAAFRISNPPNNTPPQKRHRRHNILDTAAAASSGAVQAKRRPVNNQSPARFVDKTRRAANPLAHTRAATQFLLPPPLASAPHVINKNLYDVVVEIPLFKSNEKAANFPKICPYCDMVFDSRDRAARHMRSHTGEKPFACRICGKPFTQRPDVLRHVNGLHRSRRTPISSQTEEGNVDSLYGDETSTPLDSADATEAAEFQYYKCPHCPLDALATSEGFEELSSLLLHIQTDHDASKMAFKCFICHQRYPSAERIAMHYNTEHRKDETDYGTCSERKKNYLGRTKF